MNEIFEATKKILETIRDTIREIGAWGDDPAKLSRMHGLLASLALLIIAATALIFVIKF